VCSIHELIARHPGTAILWQQELLTLDNIQRSGDISLAPQLLQDLMVRLIWLRTLLQEEDVMGAGLAEQQQEEELPAASGGVGGSSDAWGEQDGGQGEAGEGWAGQEEREQVRAGCLNRVLR
jgi:hypothetical protein